MENNPNLIETVNIPDTAKTDPQATLVMCEELRKLHRIDSIIPQPLLKVYVDIFIIVKFMCFLNVFLSYYRDRPTNAVVVWKKKPLIELVHSVVNSLSQYQEPKSTVVITEITDEEENEINSSDTMCVEENK